MSEITHIQLDLEPEPHPLLDRFGLLFCILVVVALMAAGIYL